MHLCEGVDDGSRRTTNASIHLVCESTLRAYWLLTLQLEWEWYSNSSRSSDSSRVLCNQLAPSIRFERLAENRGANYHRWPKGSGSASIELKTTMILASRFSSRSVCPLHIRSHSRQCYVNTRLDAFVLFLREAIEKFISNEIISYLASSSKYNCTQIMWEMSHRLRVTFE